MVAMNHISHLFPLTRIYNDKPEASGRFEVAGIENAHLKIQHILIRKCAWSAVFML